MGARRRWRWEGRGRLGVRGCWEGRIFDRRKREGKGEEFEELVYCVRTGAQEQYISSIDTLATKLLEAIGVIQAVSKFQHRPRIIIYRRENHAVAQQLVPSFLHIRNVHAHQRGYVLHVQSFIVLWTVLQRLVHSPRCHADIRHLSSVHPCVSSTTIADFTCVTIGPAALCFYLIQRAFDKVEMDECCF